MDPSVATEVGERDCSVKRKQLFQTLELMSANLCVSPCSVPTLYQRSDSSLSLSPPHSLPLSFSFPPARLTSEGNKTAVSGKQASLSCSYGLPEKVQQVLWKRTVEQGDSGEIASYAKRRDRKSTRLNSSHL